MIGINSLRLLPMILLFIIARNYLIDWKYLNYYFMLECKRLMYPSSHPSFPEL